LVAIFHQAETGKTRDKVAADFGISGKTWGREAIACATAIKVDAMTLMGEFLKRTPPNPGTRGQLKGKDASGGPKREPPEHAPPTLAEVGISKRESSEARALARPFARCAVFDNTAHLTPT